MKFFKHILNIGCHQSLSSLDNRRVRILNFVNLFTFCTSIFFLVLDIQGLLDYSPIRLWIDVFAIACSFVTYYLQYHLKRVAARIVFLCLLFAIIFINANITYPGHFGEYEYLILPMLAIIFFDSTVIHYGVLLLSIALFYVPNYYLEMYPLVHFGSLNTIFIFIAIFYFMLFFKVLHQKNEDLLQQANQKLEASKKNELAFLQLKTLRSQMNPHFIFNSLNSIQDLVLKQDINASYDYITLFSQLVRNTLNYSKEDFIPIEKEMEFLDVYLQLEKLRFGDEFTYDITPKEMDDLQVPSLLIQPFVENALVHGLFHQSGHKHLRIHFTYDTALTCTITDNGIGRKAVQKIQKRQGYIGHQSFALEAIKERLTLFQDQYSEEVGFTITDLYQQEVATGTEIKIVLPFKSIF